MARLLVDDQGNLRSFREWRELVTPIAAHQVGPWLQTEYSTAVLRAQQAVEWQQFEAEADVLPNLRWVPSTAVHPGADHQIFWLLLDATKGSNTILPIHHPFWDQHRPGDRWLRPDVTEGNNCHCSLEATDEHPTAPPKGFELRGNGPQPGLNENPAKTGRLFAQSHPYFPQSCAQCAFYQGGIANGFKNQEKDCQSCRFLQSEINRLKNLETYQQKHKDPNYIDVEFDEKSGGVKATHKGHKTHPNDEKRYFTEQLTGDQLEKEFQDRAFHLGHSVIFEAESKKRTDLDMKLDGLKMDLISISANSVTFKNQLSRKNEQLYKYNSQHEDNVKSVCMYFHDPSYYSEGKVIQGIELLRSYGIDVIIKKVYILLNDGSDIFDIDV